jgi:hypothetical protein
MSDGDGGEDALVQIKLRCRESLRTEIEKRASRRGRSVNGEINALLQRALAAEGYLEEAKAVRDAAYIQAIREAGLQLVHEAGGHTVNVSLELLHSTADGIIRSGFLNEKANQGRWQKAGEQPSPTEPRPVATVVDLEALMEKVIERVIARLSRRLDDDLLHEAGQYQKPPKRSRSKLQVERDTEFKPKES